MLPPGLEGARGFPEDAGAVLADLLALVEDGKTEEAAARITSVLEDTCSRRVCIVAARAAGDLRRWDLAFISLALALALEFPSHNARRQPGDQDSTVVRELAMALARADLHSLAERALRRSWQLRVGELRKHGRGPTPEDERQYMGLLAHWAGHAGRSDDAGD